MRRTLLLCVAALLACASGLTYAEQETSGSGTAVRVRSEQELTAAEEALRKGELDEAQALFSRAIATGGLEGEYLAYALTERGILYRLKGLYDQAIADYTEAIKAQPRYSTAYSNRGLAYAKSDRYDEAVRDFTRALQIEPDNAMTYFKRGNAYFDKGALDEAIADYSQAISMKPDLMRAYYNRCDAYDRKGFKDLALKDCSRVAELDPAFEPVRKALEWLKGDQKGERPCFCNY